MTCSDQDNNFLGFPKYFKFPVKMESLKCDKVEEDFKHLLGLLFVHSHEKRTSTILFPNV